MSGRCERVYVRLAPGERARALNHASRNGRTVWQRVRVLIQLPTDAAAEGACTAFSLTCISAATS